MKPHTPLNYEFSKACNENYTFSKQAYHCFVFDYFKVWDKRQLNPTYTCRISSYQHPAHHNKATS